MKRLMNFARFTGMLPGIIVAGLVLSSCGGGGAKETTAARTEKETTAVETTSSGQDKENEAYTEEKAPKNELDPSKPIPSDTGTLDLKDHVFEDEHLILRLADDMKVEHDEEKSQIDVYAADDSWKIHFEPYEGNYYLNLVNNAENEIKYSGESIYLDRGSAETEIQGFPATFWARNIKDSWRMDREDRNESLDIRIRYDDTAVGRWSGLWIRLTIGDGYEDKNIYNALYLRGVRAVLNNFEIVKGDEGHTMSYSGVTVSFPSRWKTGKEDALPWAAINDNSASGALYFSIVNPADPAEAAANTSQQYGNEVFQKSFGGKDYDCVYSTMTGGEDGERIMYTLNMYTGFSDERCLQVKLSLRDAVPETYEAYMENPDFISVMESLSLDSSAYIDPNKSSDSSGFSRDRYNVLRGYEGSGGSIVVPSNIAGEDVTEIGQLVFSGNQDITSVEFSPGISVIGVGAFSDCPNLETIILPDTVTVIDNNAFSNCPKLKDVVLPTSVIYVGSRAFSEGCTGSFTSEGPVYYDSGAFRGSSFDSITIGDNSDLSAGDVFYNANTSKINLGDGIETLGRSTFANCRNLKELVIPDSVEKLGESCFYSCGLTTIDIPERVKTIPNNCFYGTDLYLAVLPESVESIGRMAFNSTNILVLTNPDIMLEKDAFDVDRLVVEGVYKVENLPDFLEEQRFYHLDVPMDMTMEESQAMDDFLISIGMEDVSWFSPGRNFLKANIDDFVLQDSYVMEYNGDAQEIAVPPVSRAGQNIYWIADEAFKDSRITSIAMGEVTYFGHKIFDGTELSDIWFSTDVLVRLEDDTAVETDSFIGISDTVTIHLPDSIPEGDRASVESWLKTNGIPDGASFDYYSFRSEEKVKTVDNREVREKTIAVSGDLRVHIPEGMTVLEKRDNESMVLLGFEDDQAKVINVEIFDGEFTELRTAMEEYENREDAEKVFYQAEDGCNFTIIKFEEEGSRQFISYGGRDGSFWIISASGISEEDEAVKTILETVGWNF